LICRSNVFLGTVQTWVMASEPGCIAPAQGGGFVIALRDGVYLAREWAGALQPLAQLNYPVAMTRATDGKCDPRGRFWVGTYCEPRDLPLAALYCVDARGPGAVQVTQAQGGAEFAGELIPAGCMLIHPRPWVLSLGQQVVGGGVSGP
jgi:sugar lactone lactonase YvrE